MIYIPVILQGIFKQLNMVGKINLDNTIRQIKAFYFVNFNLTALLFKQLNSTEIK